MKTQEKEVNQKKKGRGKKALKVCGIILLVIVLLVGVAAIMNVVSTKANTEKAQSFEQVAIENQLVPEKDENGYWTFTTDRDFKVVQLTDVHIGGGFMSSKKDAMALNAVAAMVTAEKPDLVIVTGDVSYPVPFQAGTFNNLSSAKIFAALMEKLGVYWTLGFGNHDTEAYSYYGREDISEFYSDEEFKYCLFESGPEEVDGFGNQVINVKNSDGIITQTFYVFDSHSYVDGDYLGIMWKYDNLHENQVEWYKNTVNALNEQNNAVLKKLGKEENSDIKSAAFFHIPLTEQKDAWYEFAENGFKDTENVKFHYGVAGEGSKVVYCGIGDDGMFEAMLETGSTKAVFCGHDHYNNFSIDYKGIRLTYGMSVDYLAYPGIYKEGSQRGCTVITVSPEGILDCTAQSYYQDKYTGLYEIEEVTMQEITNLAYEEIKAE
ncbi:MAG: metallophosphoesterase [Clostridia bacterium]|nr:metallophosphoesterase [Clostridia bacterium]